MPNTEAWPLAVILLLGAVVFFYVLRARNPKLTTVIIGPLFLYLVAGVLGIGQLYVMGTMVLSVCAVCCVMAMLALRRLDVTRTASSPVSQGDGVDICVEVTNRDRFPKLLLRLRCPLPEWLEADQQTLAISGLWPGQKVVWHIRARAAKRGAYQLDPIEVTGSDPLDVFPRTSRRALPAEVLVYPHVGEVPGMDLWGEDFYGAVPARRSVRPASGLDFRSVREYQLGDDVRTIDWKTTARMSRLMVVEFEPTQIGDLVVILDNRAPVQVGRGPSATLERAISLAAGAVVTVLEARGSARLAYLLGDGPGEVAGRGPDNRPRFLAALARAEPRTGRLDKLAPADARGRVVLVITPATDLQVIELVEQVLAAGGRAVVLLLDAACFEEGGRRLPELHQGAEAMAARLRDIGARVVVVGDADALEPRGGVLRREVWR